MKFESSTCKIKKVHMININYFIDRATIDKNWCWNWNLCKDELWYWQMSIRELWIKKVTRPHRVIFELVNWKISDSKLLVCHRCDNTSCCNPEHLFLWTHKDNMQDMKSKWRSSNSPQFWNKFRAQRISILWKEFDSYTSAWKFYWITDNWVRKRFKSDICRL